MLMIPQALFEIFPYVRYPARNNIFPKVVILETSHNDFQATNHYNLFSMVD